MKLTADQVAQLYLFTRQHYVEYYDLQTELVDHLANAIEVQWEENPKLSFEQALQLEFKKFGVFGFMEVVDKRKGVLHSKYNKMVLKELRSFFSLPKIIGTFSSIGILYYLLIIFQESLEIMQWLIGFLIVSFIVGMAFLTRKQKKETAKTGKRWLLKDIIFGYSSVAGVLNILVQLACRLTDTNYPNWFLALFSLLLVGLFLTEYVVLFLIPSKAEYYLRQTYPEYEMCHKL
ncbi:hypothetical protein [Flavobacterium phycosphaerae]|uniref:hypothetical protein n=1 Tax=Flavobacterium phycosphaerae TaxID=2697515 RepID=UPI001389ABC4|nr:hypothetical protein [Flavobacterium phycosphaerae]